ncbi:NAD(P)H-hydrate dehydratase [Herbivorax sp. ANBcel31]|uniref:NAD(P)H-hydrate dehydratase n=1 Tax=Herbivorax sp. ANBcel31 TaxID=3069754 RepID=UPI0027B2DFF0|nr:NAD(P)H-hydrate dehydratase [Herbivorax sp. ANBcel31]MDQ2085616.1 NAD(P)H-hydrate dehydratase [Herbivorax sp. ANBcel31]
MIAVTPRQMGEIDRFTINEIGIPAMVLMENAALCVLREIEKDIDNIKGKRVCLFAGKGNNGGDAFAIARHLYNRGAKVLVYVLAKKSDIKGDAKTNLDILDKIGVKTIEILDKRGLDDAKKYISHTNLIVDGVFGTGIKGDIPYLIAEVINFINEKVVPVISIDIPSGINGETGQISGTCIKSYKTVTFGYAKVGLFIHPAVEYVGKIVVADIGIPKNVIDRFDIKNYIIDKRTVEDLIPKRHSDSNKGDFGKLLLLTGSKGMTGAGCLTGKAALRSGAGLLYLAVPASLTNVYDSNLIESVTLPLEDNNSGYLTKSCIKELENHMGNIDVIALGPGLSTKGDVGEVVYNIIENSKVPLVIDADGINAISKNTDILKKCSVPVVLTPHPGEMARLLNVSIDEVQKNRIDAARNFSQSQDVITVLKGSKTIVAAPDGRVYINTTGNSGMSTGGTGDVLTGIIASFICQGVEPYKSAIAGVYLHGLCGDNISKKRGEHGVIAGDLIDEISYVIKNHIKGEIQNEG